MPAAKFAKFKTLRDANSVVDIMMYIKFNVSEDRRAKHSVAGIHFLYNLKFLPCVSLLSLTSFCGQMAVSMTLTVLYLFCIYSIQRGREPDQWIQRHVKTEVNGVTKLTGKSEEINQVCMIHLYTVNSSLSK